MGLCLATSSRDGPDKPGHDVCLDITRLLKMFHSCYSRAMEWNEDGLVLAVRQHGESSAIVTLLTLEHGRHAGMVRGGGSSRARGIYQPGNLVSAVWRGRLIEHLGNFHCELLRGYAGPLLEDPFRLAILSAVCAIAETALPEREPHPDVF